MLYVKTYGEEMLIVPRNVAEMPDGDYRFVMRSTIEQKEYDVRILEASETLLMLMLWVDFPRVSCGTYEYTIKKGGREVGTGILEVCPDNFGTKEYNAIVEYDQYEE